MKNPLAVTIQWAAFAVVGPVLVALGLGLIFFGLSELDFMARFVWRNGFGDVWAMCRPVRGLGFLVCAMIVAEGLQHWWDKLPKAAWAIRARKWAQRPISSFFRHG